MAEQRHYIALVVQEEKDGSFWIHFPDFRYCFTCGLTMEEAETNAAEALATHIDGLVADGYDVPTPTACTAIMAQTELDVVQTLAVPATIPDGGAANNVTRLEPQRGPRKGGYDPA